MKRQFVLLLATVLVATSFITGVVSAPAIMNVFVTNFPSNQDVTVTNPLSTNVTVQFPVVQKTILVAEKVNVTLRPYSTGDPALDGTFIASSPADSSLGFRQATIYVHWFSISPGLSNAGLWLYATQKPSTEFPGDACALQSGGNCFQEIPYAQRQGGPGTFSMTVNVVGEQFSLYLMSGSTQDQHVSNLSIALFLSN